MALAQRKKPFSGEPKKTEKKHHQGSGIKGFSGASGILAFRSSALASFGSFLR